MRQNFLVPAILFFIFAGICFIVAFVGTGLFAKEKKKEDTYLPSQCRVVSSTVVETECSYQDCTGSTNDQ